MTRKGYRWCEKGQHNRAEKFFKPKGRVCFSCQKSGSKETAHDKRVQDLYGLGPGEYKALLEAQGGVCAICGRKPRYKMDVDHSHANNLVRGLLCKLCNRRILPAARDEPATLRKAAEYLESPPALHILGERFYSGQ